MAAESADTADERLRVNLLGPVEAGRGDSPLDLGPVRRQAVLAALVLRADTAVTQQRLLDDVWGDNPPGTGHRVLPSYVYALRRALDAPHTAPDRSLIRGVRGGYRFVPEGVHTDTAELAERAALARDARAAADLPAALEQLTTALALFRGEEPLSGLPGPLAEAERRRLAQQRRALHRQRVECLVDLGRHTEALDALDALAATASPTEPYDEPLAALRMRALYGSDRQAEALAAYRQTRDRLREELGVEPGEELRRIHQAVLRHDHRLLLGRPSATSSTPPDAPRTPVVPTRSGSAGPSRPTLNELPGDTACLVGREAELARLTAPAPPDAVSVAAVDGTAGVGKTALVVRAAWTLAAQHPDGCLFVDLHAYGGPHDRVSPQRALHRMLRALNGADDELPDGLDGLGGLDGLARPDAAAELGELVAAWRTATSGLRLLLVVDNVRAAQDVRPLIPAGPGSRVLVAGRQRLPGLDADVRLTVEPLGAGEAVGLLRHLLGADRADREPEAARELARRCGGLPLALRIAGARLQSRPTWTLTHLIGRMPDADRRLGELRAEDRSVESAFRVSYDQLCPDLQHAFRAVGHSPTSRFDALTPAAMLGRPRADAEDLLERLVDASLLQQPQPGRYRMHDLVRALAHRLAATRPAETTSARTAVLHLYTAAGRLASDWGPQGFPTGPRHDSAPLHPPRFRDWRDAADWLDGAGGELVDVVAHAATAGESDHACWIAEALVDHLVRQGRYHECRTALKLALACVDDATDRRMPSSLRNGMGTADFYQGRYRQAHDWFTDALRAARRDDETREQARALAGLGAVQLPLGRLADAVAHLTEAAELGARLDDDWLTGMTTCNLGVIHAQEGRHGRALEHYAAALPLAEKLGSPRLISKTLCAAAASHLALGDHTSARDALRTAAEQASQAGDPQLRATSLSRLAAAEHGRGDLRAALALHHEALATLNEHSSTTVEIEIRSRLAHTYMALGRHTEAEAEFRKAHSLPGATTHPLAQS
ncbi:AfsR/SARP family transcriptional regulator, partial [Streptomyces alkaliterrae]|uniref:AfsR/SARP family transcriptional regulator n=3 Tax=Streptomyces alkaliterrae TaxID=2213162 RepID=UPI002B205CCA